MIFSKLDLIGSYLIESQLIEDERGFFSRIVCEREFAEHGLTNSWIQQNIAFNHKKGTLRGMHYQNTPYEEIKVVRCTHGAIYDVLVDLRRESPTYKKWLGFELSAENHKMLYIPAGFAHGYLTLTDEAEITYLVSQSYHPDAEAGIRYDDPSIGINWNAEIVRVSEKDKNLPWVT
jgi:dTDP-4-dehydrorhamnose 3,5-epimerase